MKLKPGAWKRGFWMACLFPIWGPFPFVVGTRLAAFCFHAFHTAPVYDVEQRVGKVVWLLITCILVRLIVFKKANPQQQQHHLQPQMEQQPQ